MPETLYAESRTQERDTLRWEDVRLPDGILGILIVLDPDRADGTGYVVESPGLDGATLHANLLMALRASYKPADGDPHSLALDTALATWNWERAVVAHLAANPPQTPPPAAHGPSEQSPAPPGDGA